MTDFSAVKPGFVRRRSAIHNARRAERLATGKPNRSDIGFAGYASLKVVLSQFRRKQRQSAGAEA